MIEATWAIKLFRAFEIAMVLGGIILIHELGHYLVGKWSRMRVEEFAIGIGPTIKSWERGGTLYRLCPFLFMGYVRICGLEGEQDADVIEGSFYTRPHSQRLAVIMAGSVTNVICAALLFCVLYGFWGVPDIRSDTTLAQIMANSAASEAGVQPGWRITAVDGHDTPQPEMVEQRVRSSNGKPVVLTLEREAYGRADQFQAALTIATDAPALTAVEAGSIAARQALRPGDLLLAVGDREVTDGARVEAELAAAGHRQLKLAARREVTLKPRWSAKKERYLVGVVFRDDNANQNVIQRVEPGGAADQAGLEPGDAIVAVDGRPTTHPMVILQALTEVAPDLELSAPEQVSLRPREVTVERGGQDLTVTLIPQARRQQREQAPVAGQVAADQDLPLENYLVGNPGLTLEPRFKHLGLVGSIGYGLQRSQRIVEMVLEGLGLLARGRKLDQVGGPVAILRLLSDAAVLGPYDLFEMAGTLSIMIGVFNLLPLPALDGGRVVFILLEWLFRRPMLSRAKESMVHSVGLLVLLGLIVLVSIRDVQRW